MSKICLNFARVLCRLPQTRLYSIQSYKSSISLEKLYPNSSLKLTTPSTPPIDANEKFSGYIPIEKLDISYSRSSGPGGQNVNKVNTKVEIRFKPSSATWISQELKEKLIEKFKNKITKEGFLIFRSDLTRSQQMNLADALEKIRCSIRNCIVVENVPSEETQEKIRRRIERVTRERLAIKRERSHIKSERQSPTV